MEGKTKKQMENLVARSRDCIVCAIDESGLPSAKCMFRRKNDGLKTIWFSTNTSSIHVAQFQNNPNACVYFVNHRTFHGLSLQGKMQVLTDDASKQSLWKPTDVMYYPKGVTDPDYCVLKFTLDKGNHYHGLSKHLFEAADI